MGHGRDAVGGSGVRAALQLMLCIPPHHSNPPPSHPRPLISYIRKFYYYDPQEEVYLSLKEAQLISRQKQDAESST